MLSAFFGVVAAALGFWGVWIWRHEFVQFLKGMVPISLFMAGILALIIGLASVLTKPHPMLRKKDHEEE